jgi:hypothetical protein
MMLDDDGRYKQSGGVTATLGAESGARIPSDSRSHSSRTKQKQTETNCGTVSSSSSASAAVAVARSSSAPNGVPQRRSSAPDGSLLRPAAVAPTDSR